MQVTQILAFSLAVVSSSAMAFQAKTNDASTFSREQVRSVEYAIYGRGAAIPATNQNRGVPGTCAAVPVNGCGCPFCTQLRNQQI
jgi:hypothetical protein